MNSVLEFEYAKKFKEYMKHAGVLFTDLCVELVVIINETKNFSLMAF